MKVLLDTNIIIDILERREPFYDDSYKVLLLGLEGEIETIMAAGDITNVFYIIKKSIHNSDLAREKIFIISNMVKICNSTPEDIANAIVLFIQDFEDAIIAATAKREKADYIITRNEEDFANSPVPPLSPAALIKMLKNKIA